MGDVIMENKTLVELAQQLGRLEKSREHHLSKAQEADEKIAEVKKEIAAKLSGDMVFNNA